MITGKDLKRMVSLIPDDAYVTVNGNYDVSVESVKVESADPLPRCDETEMGCTGTA